MSNMWLNVMVLGWHFQAGDPSWYCIKVSYNGWHKEHEWPDGRFVWY